MNNFKKFLKSDSTTSVLSSVVSIIIGMLVGFVVMLVVAITDKNISIGSAFKGLGYLLKGPFGSTVKENVLTNIGNVIFYSVPLIMTGLSVGIAYKTGLFNIGAPGQYIMGIIGSLTIALNFHASTPAQGVLLWVLAIICGCLLGMIWGMIPGILKAFFNINEVIICIMTNWTAANIASWYFSNNPQMISTENTKAAYLRKTIETGIFTPNLGLDKLFNNASIDVGIFIAIALAIVVYIILNKTTLGYSLKACGSNRNASKYAGLNEKKYIILSMALAGGLAAIGAALYYLNPKMEYNYQAQYAALPSYGFNGIASSFLAGCNPIGTIFSSILIRYLNQGGEHLTLAGYNRYIADIIISIIIYVAGFTMIFKNVILKLLNKERKPKVIVELPDDSTSAQENEVKEETTNDK